jgi:hypothetical protein
MKPPTIKLDNKYSIKYIQVPYDNRYYVIMMGHKNIGYKECVKIPCSESELVDYFIDGIISRMNNVEKIDLYKRFEAFKARVDKKDKLLDASE